MTANDWKCQGTLIRICWGQFFWHVWYVQFSSLVRHTVIRTIFWHIFLSGNTQLFPIFPTVPSFNKSVQSKDCEGDQFRCVTHFTRQSHFSVEIIRIQNSLNVYMNMKIVGFSTLMPLHWGSCADLAKLLESPGTWFSFENARCVIASGHVMPIKCNYF